MTTERPYADTVGELKDRRARKKAQTRELIRSVARGLFDEHGFENVTIADVARACDVAVQTVFNHFATKEELFFDGRAPWVDAPAEAVRFRDPSIAPLTALRAEMVELVTGLVATMADPERLRYLMTLEASDALRAHERELVNRSEVQLREALLEAWTSDGVVSPIDPEATATLTAAVWMAAGRSLVAGQRSRLIHGADPDLCAANVTDLADRLLREMESAANVVHRPRGTASRADTGWPRTSVRRAG